MPRKKQKTKRAPRRRVVNKIVTGLKEAITTQDAINLRNNQAMGLPSAEAMGLAEMLLDRATRKKRKGEVTQIVVAEMIESALRVRRAAAETSGSQKGQQEAREGIERLIVEGVMGRIGMMAEQKRASVTIALAYHEAQVINNALVRAGYAKHLFERREPEQRDVWTMRNIEAKHERVD